MWSQREFEVNSDVAANIASIFTQYYQIPYIVTGHSDNYFAYTVNTLAQDYLNDLIKNGTVSTTTVNLAKQDRPTSTPIVQNLYQEALNLQQQIPSSRQGFYQSYILTQLLLQVHGCLTLQGICDSIVSFNPTNTAQALNYLQGALVSYESIFAAERLAELGGKWKGLYRGDTLVNFQYTRRYVLKVIAQIQKLPLPKQQNSTYYEFYNYQFPFQDNYPLMNYNSDYNLNSYVRVTCTNLPQCQNLPEGGVFATSAIIQMAILQPNTSIYYTIDGTNPTKNSLLYKSPITVTQTTHIKSIGFTNSNGNPLTVLTDLTFTKTN